MASLSSRKSRWPPGVLKQAAGLMRHEARSKRSRYDSWPYHVRRTLQLYERPPEGFDPGWRKIPIEERLELADTLKHKGSEHYREGRWDESIELYTQAAGLFHFVERTGRSPGNDAAIEDRLLRLVTDEGPEATESMPSTRDRVRALRGACYANIAQCLLRRAGHGDLTEACHACDEVLALNPSSVKALFRRAAALESLGGSQHLEEAARDLASAEELLRRPAEATCDEALLAEVRRARTRVLAERRRIIGADQRAFRGFFDRASASRPESGNGSAAATDPDMELRRAIVNADKLREAALAEGNLAEAKEMEETAARGRARLAERSERAARGIDILNPSKELIEQAKLFGVDLTDPEERKRVDQSLWQTSEVLADRTVATKAPRDVSWWPLRGTSRDTVGAIVVIIAALWLLVLVRAGAAEVKAPST
eukprot:gnl/TRDRNA2_/TRDRNA2_196069_c0_seq1.p1 gnl/TRDRNA2_/TRDRNA2_196069_c0~~gnl/TRDRNA2_/TRDRNA2_196069_c0_seq1.p1  ORF type:complete len:427 (+),score=81.71 gnl/TRDRNA2_/TRDRNA2_196069_c0_seq1:42-1322(+)